MDLTIEPTVIKKLNWGCGEHTAAGWVNCDVKDGRHVDVSCDIRDGLPFPDDDFDYITSIHALPELPFPQLVPTISELRRVLRVGGILRLVLPDLDKGIAAYHAGNRDYFLVPDADVQSISGKLIVQLLWYGWSRSMYTAEFTEELLRNAGFDDVRVCSYLETSGDYPGITELDNREHESLFIEAVK